jgi:F-box interacting protein
MYAMDAKTGKKNRRTSKAAELLDELVVEILVRLPVKSLLRFKSVSKAWHANITDPAFVRAHLQRRSSEWKQNPSMLITPHTLDRVIPGELLPTTFSNRIRFYQWQQGSSEATLVHGEDFPSEFHSACFFAHCDGLVLAPTDTKVYVFNPATRATITLPESSRKVHTAGACLPVGLGLDPRTGKYKVVRSFYRSTTSPHTTGGVFSMGMEVYTIGNSAASWRETAVDPPYAVAEFITAKSVRGGMFWIIDKRHVSQCPHGLLRFSLEDKAFDITCLPDSLDPALDESFLLDVLHGEQLCLTAPSSRNPATQHFMVWTLAEDAGMNSQWEPRYQVHVSDLFRPMALLPDGALMLWASHSLFRYDFGIPELTSMCELEVMKYQRRRAGTFETARHDIYGFNVLPYTESLVNITSS